MDKELKLSAETTARLNDYAAMHQISPVDLAEKLTSVEKLNELFDKAPVIDTAAEETFLKEAVASLINQTQVVQISGQSHTGKTPFLLKLVRKFADVKVVLLTTEYRSLPVNVLQVVVKDSDAFKAALEQVGRVKPAALFVDFNGLADLNDDDNEEVFKRFSNLFSHGVRLVYTLEASEDADVLEAVAYKPLKRSVSDIYLTRKRLDDEIHYGFIKRGL